MPHPRIDEFDRLVVPERSAAAMGYHMPAEWEPQAAVWLSRPANAATWPGCLDRAIEQFDAWVDALRRHVPVCMTQAMGIATDDAWLRDAGPIFVVRDTANDAVHAAHRPPTLALHDFRFTGWGGKYGADAGACERDDLVPQQIARRLGAPVWVHEFVLEGGSIDVNGRGAALSTEQCLLNANRNAGWSRRDIEHKLDEALGVHHIIWLPGGIEGDDTDGHIDDVARFVGPDAVAAVRAPRDHPDHAMLERNWHALERAHDQAGHRLTLFELPAPPAMHYDSPAGHFAPDSPAGRYPLPASYANFLISNGAVFAPVFGQPTDEPALRAIERALPGRAVVPVPSDWLVVGLGTLHCLSQQQPAGLDGMAGLGRPAQHDGA